MASGFFVVGTNSFLGVLDLWVTGAQWKISQTILLGRDAILRVRDKWLIFNIILQLWADVKYHVPTNKKKHRFHHLKQDKIGTIIFQFHFTDP